MRRLRKMAMGAALACGLLGRARGAPPQVALGDAVRVSPGLCLSADVLVPEIARWLRADAIDARLRVEVDAQADDAEVRFVLLRDGEIVGEKRMAVGRMPCAERTRAVGLAVASAVEAAVLDAPARRPSASSVAPPAPAPEAPSSVLAPRAPPRAALAPMTFLLALDASVSGTHLPAPIGHPLVTLLVSPGVELRPLPWLDVRAALAFTPEVSTAFAAGRLHVQLVYGEASGCAGTTDLPLRLRACVGLGAGAMPTRVEGVTTAQRGAEWAAMLVRADARFPARGRVAAVLSVSLAAPFLHPTFASLAEELHRGLGVAAGLGVQVTVFP
jgi:hypothetical protein